MPRHQLTFQQVLILPLLTTLGLGCWLGAQHVSLVLPVDAAPLSTPNPALVLDAIQVPTPRRAPQRPPARGPVAAVPAALPQASASTPAGPEFSGAGGDRIRATSAVDLVRLARENSGREDPFVALTNPDPSLVMPLPVAMAVPEAPTNVRSTFKVATHPGATPKGLVMMDPPQAGDEPVRGPMVVPHWSLSGVLNTGREQIALLEWDGKTRETRLGEVLDDGARLVKIETNRVVLILNGRRFPKTIGGGDQ